MHTLLRAGVVVAVALAIALPAAAAAAPVTSHSRITQRGLGSIRLGMTVEQARRRTGQRIQHSLFTPGDTSCGIAQLFPRGLGVDLQTTNLHVWVINVSSRGIATRAGVRVGDRVAALRRAYGSRLRSEPNKYTPKARDYWVGFGRRKLKFSANPEGVIREISSGRKPEVDFVEGCA